MTAQAYSHTHANWRHGEASRAAALDQIDRNIAALKRCVVALLARGVFVIEAHVREGALKPTVTVAASPYLHTLFKDDCSSGQHHDERLGRTVRDFVAPFEDCQVHWSEAKQ